MKDYQRGFNAVTEAIDAVDSNTQTSTQQKMQQLQQMLSRYPGYSGPILAAMSNIKQTQVAAQGAQPPLPSVAQQIITTDTSPQQNMAKGGIVAFKQGGEVRQFKTGGSPADEEILTKRAQAEAEARAALLASDPAKPFDYDWPPTSEPAPVDTTPPDSFDPYQEGWRSLGQGITSGVVEPAVAGLKHISNFGRGVGNVVRGGINVLGGHVPYTPYYDTDNAVPEPRNPAIYTTTPTPIRPADLPSVAEPQGERPSLGGLPAAGIVGGRRAAAPAPAIEQTDYSKYMLPQTSWEEELKKIHTAEGTNKAMEEYMANRAQQKTDLAARRSDLRNEGLLNLGLGMMGTRSPYFLQAVGEAGAGALTGYQKGRAELDTAAQAGIRDDLLAANITRQDERANLSEARATTTATNTQRLGVLKDMMLMDKQASMLKYQIDRAATTGDRQLLAAKITGFNDLVQSAKVTVDEARRMYDAALKQDPTGTAPATTAAYQTLSSAANAFAGHQRSLQALMQGVSPDIRQSPATNPFERVTSAPTGPGVSRTLR